MAKYTGPKCKLARAVGEDLGLKSGVRSHDSKCREKRPGQHGDKKRRVSDYGQQLMAKQKIRYTYGVLERQFRNYYKKAASMKGATGENLMQLLESRLDNVVYRLGFGATRAEARQVVTHRSILVNGQSVNIPSYNVKPGDEIEVREKSKSQARILGALALAEQRTECEWVDINVTDKKGMFKRYPTLDDLPPSNIHLVVELYSK